MDLISILVSLIILIYSAILHEIAHGFVAERLGDPTARLMGRLTLNPKSHIDPMMTLAFPLLTYFASGGTLIFGGAKPVPVDPFNFREPKKDMGIVSLAGPGTNLLLALAGAILIKAFLFVALIGGLNQIMNVIANPVLNLLILVVRINLLLGIFNLIPIPPLDGSKVFALILPDREAAMYLSIGSIGIFIIFFLLLSPIGGFSLGGLISNLLVFSLHLLGLN
jgi:Zn-dependent protease